MTRARFSRLLVPRKASDDALLGILSLHGPLGFEIAGKDLVAFFRGSEAARDASDALRSRRVRHELTTDILETDPLEAWRAASRPFPVGRRFWIDPGDPGGPAPPSDRIALFVPASRAFGTGGHESTRLALLALEEEDLDGKTLLDVGTGSGILALAAAALGARRSVGLDLDAEAIFVARENLGRHAFGGRVGLYAGPLGACAGRFDAVVANMLAEEILPEAGALLARAGRLGRVVLSGLTRESEPAVLERVRTGKWKLAGRRTEKEWVCLTLTRG
jgi:ribosomal protein L11 methyltransferase